MATESQNDRRRTASAARAKLSRAVWRWHFFAGLLVAPVLIAVSLTGALYVFRVELEPLLYPQMLAHESTSSQTRVSYQQQWETANSAVPEDSKLFFISIPKPHDGGTTRATYFRYLLPTGDQRFVFTNPYTGEITGTIERSSHIFEIILRIHRRLFAGTFGRVLVELATSWAIMLVLSGLYLWAPKFTKWKGAGVLWPRLSGSRYQVLRDLHSVPSAYLSLFMVLVLITGLFFTQFWGTGFRGAALATGGLPKVVTDPPKSTVPTDPADLESSVTVDQAFATMRGRGYADYALSVSPPQDEDGTFSVSARGEYGPSIHSMIHLDRYTGEILYENDGEGLPWMTVVLLLVLPIHQGSVFGLPTKILAFLAAIGLVALVVTGCWMWWTRRPRGKLGLPRRYADAHIPAWMLAMIVCLGVFLPVVGVSLLLVLAGDYLWNRFQPAAAG